MIGFMIFIIGIILGSFITLISYRLPKKTDVIFKASNCVHCNHKLGFFDLIPVISWITQGGKCRYCNKKISIRYPLIEITSGFICLHYFTLYGLSFAGLALCILSLILLSYLIMYLENHINMKANTFLFAFLLVVVGLIDPGFLNMFILSIMFIISCKLNYDKSVIYYMNREIA